VRGDDVAGGVGNRRRTSAQSFTMPAGLALGLEVVPAGGVLAVEKRFQAGGFFLGAESMLFAAIAGGETRKDD